MAERHLSPAKWRNIAAWLQHSESPKCSNHYDILEDEKILPNPRREFTPIGERSIADSCELETIFHFRHLVKYRSGSFPYNVLDDPFESDAQEVWDLQPGYTVEHRDNQLRADSGGSGGKAAAARIASRPSAAVMVQETSSSHPAPVDETPNNNIFIQDWADYVSWDWYDNGGDVIHPTTPTDPSVPN